MLSGDISPEQSHLHLHSMPKTLWAYDYRLLPPQTVGRMRGVRTLLNHAHQTAERGARTWSGRIVFEPLMTHILVVSDGPEQNREVNRELEAELKGLKVGFTLTASMLAGDSPV